MKGPAAVPGPSSPPARDGLCRSLLAAAAICSAIVLTLLVVVLPAVRQDTFPGATPERAVPAFVVLGTLFAALAGIYAMLAARARRAAVPGPAASATVLVATIALAVPLLDAATAYLGHGPGMQRAAFALFIAAAATAGAFAGVLIARLRHQPGRRDAA